VSGIGFLGAGAIIRQGLSVRGLTTAATLWVVAAIGLAAGAGYYVAAALTTAIALVSLGPLRIAAYRVVRRFRAEEGRLLVSLPSGTSPGGLIDEIEHAGLRILSLEIGHEADRRNVELDVQVPAGKSPSSFVARLADVPDVLEVRWQD
jgi:putative Mg2+ transporter-C (MgtC) family protein